MSEEIVHMPGEVIFEQGDTGDYAYVVQSGEVEIYQVNPDGVEEVIAIVAQGQMFGELAILDDAPRSASARARTLVRLQIVPL